MDLKKTKRKGVHGVGKWSVVESRGKWKRMWIGFDQNTIHKDMKFSIKSL